MDAIPRNTKQRRAMQAVFDQADRPLSIEEVWSGIRRLEPRVALATVYRNVRTMVEDGDLALVHFPGQPSRYEREGKGHHHHFECRACNKAFELSDCEDQARIKVPRGFKVHGHEVVVYGLCATCAAKK